MEASAERAGYLAYNAFLEKLRSFLPHTASEWHELPAPLQEAWAAAAMAARNG